MNNELESGQSLITRLWQKDRSLWPDTDADSITNRLGWLDAVEWMNAHIGALNSWAQQTAGCGKFDTVILLGMGGSSLSAEVFSAVFGRQPGYLQLRVIDTTSPAQINALDVDLARSLIIVASKSGGTVETADLFAYFHAQLRNHTDCPGDNLIAITDQNSWLHQQAIEMQFTRIFLNPPDIGGRYSALSYFGLVPAALIGVRLNRLLAQTKAFSDRCQANNPAGNSVSDSIWQLAKLMGNGDSSGRNILQLWLAPPLQSLAVWIEQLVAESLGKKAQGILPVYAESPDTSWDGASDSSAMPNQSDSQASVYIGLDGEEPGARTQTMATDMQWHLGDRYDIGGEFLRWEMATALAASMMNINPFDQPDVEQAKQQTRLFVTGLASQPFSKLFENQHYIVYTDTGDCSDNAVTIATIFDRFGADSTESLYLAILAYLPNFVAVNDRLQALRRRLAQRFALVTTLGYGPRYLHSTGQLHKGGPACGCFIQITEQSMAEIAIPGQQYGFSDLHRAQADGDYSVLAKKALPLMRVTLKGNRLEALGNLLTDLSA